MHSHQSNLELSTNYIIATFYLPYLNYSHFGWVQGCQILRSIDGSIKYMISKDLVEISTEIVEVDNLCLLFFKLKYKIRYILCMESGNPADTCVYLHV